MKNLDAGPFHPVINSFALHLRAEDKAAKTVRTYTEAAAWFAAEYLRRRTDYADWDQVQRSDVEAWIAWLLEQYSDTYANNQYRALQQFFGWWAEEEELPNPMAKTRPPKVDDRVVPIFTADELSRLRRSCEGRGFEQRRDYAICGKERILRFGHTAARALDDRQRDLPDDLPPWRTLRGQGLHAQVPAPVHPPLAGQRGRRSLHSWSTAMDTTGNALGDYARSGRLRRGLREILVHHVLFHWNRLGVTPRAQSILAHTAAIAVLDTAIATRTFPQSSGPYQYSRNDL